MRPGNFQDLISFVSESKFKNQTGPRDKDLKTPPEQDCCEELQGGGEGRGGGAGFRQGSHGNSSSHQKKKQQIKCISKNSL